MLPLGAYRQLLRSLSRQSHPGQPWSSAEQSHPVAPFPAFASSYPERSVGRVGPSAESAAGIGTVVAAAKGHASGSDASSPVTVRSHCSAGLEAAGRRIVVMLPTGRRSYPSSTARPLATAIAGSVGNQAFTAAGAAGFVGAGLALPSYWPLEYC